MTFDDMSLYAKMLFATDYFFKTYREPAFFGLFCDLYNKASPADVAEYAKAVDNVSLMGEISKSWCQNV